METLRAQLAELFETSPKLLRLDPVVGGLSFSSYHLRIGKENYFVKVYPATRSIASTMQRINTLMLTMRERGIPAPEVVLYSSRAPNLAIHKFVQGQHYTGQPGELEAIARLCSQNMVLGLTNRQKKSRESYVNTLTVIGKELDNMSETASGIDPVLHTRVQSLAKKVLDTLLVELSTQAMLHIPVHDDFTEKNILLHQAEVVLLCDWDSFRVKLLEEYLACCATRFSTTAPLSGELECEKLRVFLRQLDAEVVAGITQLESFASLFPVLATLKHLRTYPFRNAIVNQGRPELRTPLLEWPISHCEWLLQNRNAVSDCVLAALGNSGR